MSARWRRSVRRGVLLSWMSGLPIVSTAWAQEPAAKFAVELEAGATWQSYNDVRIPNDSRGTRLALPELTGSGPWASGRVYLTWQPNRRHGLRLLLAPFSLSATGVSETPISFAEASYAGGRAIQATYTFNSYRLTYRYAVRETGRTTAWVGFTAKVRDAVIALEQDGISSRKEDLGFVPLLHLAGQWRPAHRWHFSMDADVIAGGPGRAEDVAVKLGRDLGRRWTVEAGYRMIEGGADVASVYTFAWLHSGVISVRRFW